MGARYVFNNSVTTLFPELAEPAVAPVQRSSTKRPTSNSSPARKRSRSSPVRERQQRDSTPPSFVPRFQYDQRRSRGPGRRGNQQPFRGRGRGRDRDRTDRGGR